MRTRDRETDDVPRFQPEPLVELQKRYQFVLSGRKHAEHCFDFESGLRLVISRGSFFNLRVSASFQPGSAMAFEQVARLRSARSDRERAAARDDWYASIEASFRELSGCTGPFELDGISPKGVPHWKVS